MGIVLADQPHQLKVLQMAATAQAMALTVPWLMALFCLTSYQPGSDDR